MKHCLAHIIVYRGGQNRKQWQNLLFSTVYRFIIKMLNRHADRDTVQKDDKIFTDNVLG